MDNTIIVVGTISTGKSTLLNTILRDNVMKMGDGHTTTELEEFIFNDLKLVDIPGLNTTGMDYLSKYKTNIKRALAIFVIYEKSTIESEAMDKILRNIYQWRKENLNKNVYHILNKIDDINDLDEIKSSIVEKVNSIVETVYDIDDTKYRIFLRVLANGTHVYKISGNIDNNNVIAISAKNALSYIMFKKDKENEEQYKCIMSNIYGRRWNRYVKTDVDDNELDELYAESNFMEIDDLLVELKKHLFKFIINNNKYIPLNKLKTLTKTTMDTNSLYGTIVAFTMALGSVTYLPRYELYGIVCYILLFHRYYGLLTDRNGNLKCVPTKDELEIINKYINYNYTRFYDMKCTDPKYTYKYKDITFCKLNDNIYSIEGIFCGNIIEKIDRVIKINETIEKLHDENIITTSLDNIKNNIGTAQDRIIMLTTINNITSGENILPSKIEQNDKKLLTDLQKAKLISVIDLNYAEFKKNDLSNSLDENTINDAFYRFKNNTANEQDDLIISAVIKSKLEEDKYNQTIDEIRKS
jgi:GTP-binding protein EngB required for normal cell division